MYRLRNIIVRFIFNTSGRRNSNQPLFHILVGYSNEVKILVHKRKVDLLPITPVADLIIVSGTPRPRRI